MAACLFDGRGGFTSETTEPQSPRGQSPKQLVFPVEPVAWGMDGRVNVVLTKKMRVGSSPSPANKNNPFRFVPQAQAAVRNGVRKRPCACSTGVFCNDL